MSTSSRGGSGKGAGGAAGGERDRSDRSGSGAAGSAGGGADGAGFRESKSDDISEVLLDGLVVLKIIKHCKESLPTLVAGSLLGLDVKRSLEVTNCFPFPSDDKGEASGADYQMEMMKMLREVNVDNNQVGWYQSTYLGSFCHKDLISTQVEFQETFGSKAVVVIFDPRRTTRGFLALQAFRLTPEFMAAHKEGKFDLGAVDGVSIAASGIFEEVPVRVRNAHLFRAMLFEMADSSRADVEGVDFDRLDLASNRFLELNLQFVLDRVSELAAMQRETSYWEKEIHRKRSQQQMAAEARALQNKERIKAGEEPYPEEEPRSLEGIAKVDRLDTLLLTAQVGKYCDQINRFAGQSFSKLFLAGSLHKD